MNTLLSKNSFLSAFAVIFVTVVFTFAQMESGTERGNDGAMVWQKVTASATVNNINRDNNEVTLEDEDGNTFTVTLDEKVDLSQINNGDKVKVTYFRSLASDFREPTPEERKNPLVVTDETIDAPEGTEPAAGDLKQIRAVVEIVDVDKDNQTITVKGPQDNEYVLYVSDPSNLDKVKEGDTMTVIYTQALAVSLVKAE